MNRRVFISKNCDMRLSDWLKSSGHTVICINTSGIVAGPVSDHPDMFICRLGFRDDSQLISYWDLPDMQHAEPDSPRLSPDYPNDVSFNAACTGKFFIHNLKYTAPKLLKAAEDSGMRMVDVKQGYARCSTVIVDEDSVITYDRGIASACESAGLNVLTVRPGYVLLPGYDTGFIGGTSGRIGDTVIFNGDLASHPDSEAIIGFIRSRGLKVKWFSEWPLTDTGSII